MSDTIPLLPITAPSPLTPPQFKLRFSSMERIGIRLARTWRAADAPTSMTAAEKASRTQIQLVLDDWFDILDDPRLKEVDLTLQSTIDSAQFLVAAGLLTEQRAVEILAPA